MTINFSNYKMIVLSATTEGYVSTDLKNFLKKLYRGILNMNYEMLDDLGMIPGTGEAYWSSTAYIDNSTAMDIYNFDNYGAWASNVFTGGDFKSGATAFMWAAAGNANA